MILHINGEPRTCAEGLTVTALVGELGMKTDRIAVELNLEIVPRSQWDSTHLKDGDKLEIVHFVGGGSADAAEAEAKHDEAPTPGSPSASWLCPTCSKQATGKFCGSCGEKKADRGDLSLRHLFSHAVEVVFHADSRIIRSSRDLFTRPGLLTAEYVRGRRKPYLHPFQVFFIANVLYFLLQPLTGWSGLKTPLDLHTSGMLYSSLARRLVQQRLSAKGITLNELTHSFNHVVDIQARSLVVLMVPMFAAVVWLLEFRKRRPFGEHLVFALHFLAVFLIGVFILFYGGANLAISTLARSGIHIDYSKADVFLYPIAAALLGAYVLQALRVSYGDTMLMAFVKAVILVASPLLVLQVYRFILFLTALYSA